MNDFETQLQSLSGGHALLAACCVLYLAWWCVFFRPRETRPAGLEYGIGVALIIGAILCGLFAVLRIGGALMDMPSAVPAGILWPVAIVAYGVLAYLSARFLDRPITTELVLIVAWTALEISVVGTVAAVGGAHAGLLLALAIIACIGALACYLVYYRLSGWPAFLDGCGPLVAIGILSVVYAALI